MSATATTIRALADPLAAAAGLDLVDVQVRGSGRRRLVRVIVDRKGGVDLARCQALSRRLSARLDEADPIPGRYALEVTSPGVDAPLRDQRAFDRVEGRRVLVRRTLPDGRVQEVEGTVLASGEEGVVLDADGGPVTVRYDEIASARQRLPW